MPAEAIHMTALDDTLVALPAKLRARLVATHTLRATRLGAMFVDLPYFDAVASTLVRHVLGLSPRPLPWGDILHQRAPITLGRRIGELGVKLLRQGQKEAGEYTIALSLGYMCHAAIDTALHPVVNRLAAIRAAEHRDHPLRQHREVEKFHSVLFHEDRHGRDFLGTSALQEFLSLDVAPLWQPGPIADTVATAFRECLHAQPARSAFQRWEQGLRRYLAILCGPLGRHAVSVADKERERPALYDAIDFGSLYDAARKRSITWVTTFAEYLDSDGDPTALHAVIPEQSLDPPYVFQKACA